MKKIVVVKVGVGDMPSAKAAEYTDSVGKKFKKILKKEELVVLSIRGHGNVELEVHKF